MLSPLDPIRQRCGPLHFEAAAVLGRFQRRRLTRGEHWVVAGATARRLAFVASGLLRHSRVTPDGRELTRWATLPGQFAAVMPSLTQGLPSEDTITSAQETEVLELDHHVWAELRAEHPQLQAFWVGTLEWLAGCMEARVWSLISSKAEARYAYMLERYPEFILSLPQHYLADMLGIAPRHLSRIRGNL